MSTHLQVKQVAPTRACRDCPTMLPPGSKRLRCEGCGLTRKRRLQKEAKQRWAKANPEAQKVISNRGNFKFKYGVTPEQAEEVRIAQGGVCAMRGCSKEAIRVDHCHDTGVFRGWLCHGCNVRLSGIEDTTFLAAAIEYLDQRREGVVQVGLTKHGEGSVLPDDEGQKTAQQGGLSAEAAAELARENEEADGATDGATSD